MSKRGLHLYKRLALTTLTALIGLGGAAQADTHAAGPVYAGPTGGVGGQIFCWVFNFGTPVSITAALLFDNTGAQVTTAGSCQVTLGTNQSCFYGANISTANLAYSCRVIDQSASSMLSGAAVIISSPATGGTVLSNLPLQNSQ
jgi:hypothetical protein